MQALETELAERAEELARSERRVEAMKQVGRALGSSLDLDRLLDEIVRRTTELLEADRSTLFLVDRAAGELWSKVLEGDAHHEIRLPIGAGIAGWVAQRGRPLLVADAYSDPRFNRDFDLRSGYVTRDVLTWPIRRLARDEVIGVIQVLNKRVGRFDRSDERLIEAIASEIGVALEVATLYREAVQRSDALEKARRELALLFATERALSDASDLAEMLGAILETALDTMGARTGAVHVVGPSGESLETIAARGPGARLLLAKRLRIGEGPAGQVLRTGEPLLVHAPEGLARGRLRVRAVLAVPIRARDEGLLGALELLETRGGRRPFDDDDARTLAAVASQAGRAIVGERRRREREQHERLGAIGQMLAGVLHDLRTPMTLITGYTELMASSDRPAERARWAQLVLRQIELLTSMTRELLAFARGERSILVRKVRLERFMDEMREYLTREFEGGGVTLELDVRARGWARFDESKLRRVFHNLGRNAREAMPGGGHFWVRAEEHEGALVLTFEDDGPGIPPELGARLFQPFSTAGKPEGTGLGLAMVKQIAEEHRGRVEAAPRRGGGTSFRITLPEAWAR